MFVTKYFLNTYACNNKFPQYFMFLKTYIIFVRSSWSNECCMHVLKWGLLKKMVTLFYNYFI